MAIISNTYSHVYLLKSSSDYPVNSLARIKFIKALDSVTVSDVMDDIITPTLKNDEAELLIIASIQTLKRKYKRYGRDEVFELVKDSTDDDTVTKETFDRLLNQLINNNSVKLNTMCNDSANMMHFSFFTILFFPPTQKITIPKKISVS